MSENSPQPESLGPPAKSSVDWYFTPRPGRQLDAARVKLASEEVREFRISVKGYLKFLLASMRSRLATVGLTVQVLLNSLRG